MQLRGVLFFPVTPFASDGALDLDAFEHHFERGLKAGPGAAFVACGTGEFHALSADEHREVVKRAVDVAAGRLPVFAGCGGPLGHALAVARRAQAEGVAGLLVLPPYLAMGPQRGLVNYMRAIADAVSLPLVAYSRGNAVFAPEAARELATIPGVIGLKDGHGDLELLERTMAAVREVSNGFLYFNGLPTAEAFMPEYRRLGVDLYSSATFAFAPEIALGFYEALTCDDHARVELYLDTFYRPLVALRDTVEGYAIALIKAGAELRGEKVGPVRPPLVDVTREHRAVLQTLLAAGLELSSGAGHLAAEASAR